MILEEFKSIKKDKKEIRKFAYTVGIVLLILGAVMLYFGKASYPYFLTLSAALIIPGLIFPKVLTPVYLLWMGLAVVLGWISTRMILIILFYLILFPIKLLASISGKKFLQLKPDASMNSYWIRRDDKQFDPSDYEKQF